MPARRRASPATVHSRLALPCSQGYVQLAQTRCSACAHTRSMPTCVRPSCPDAHLGADVGPRAQQHQQAGIVGQLQEELHVGKAVPHEGAWFGLMQVPGHVRLRGALPSAATQAAVPAVELRVPLPAERRPAGRRLHAQQVLTPTGVQECTLPAPVWTPLVTGRSCLCPSVLPSQPIGKA